MSWVSVAEFAATAGVSPKTIRGMVERGELRAYRVGRLVRLDPDEAREDMLMRPGGMDAPARRPTTPRPITGEFSRRAREGV
jgi:excisionase family DNA binding protein